MTDIETPPLPAKPVSARRSLFVVSATVLILALLMGITALLIYNTLLGQAQRGTTLAQQVQEACSDPTVNTSDLGALCKSADDVVEQAPTIIQGTKGDPGEQGEQGEPGPPPSNTQIASAVARWCNTGACTGKSGKNATAADVARAVAQFCNNHGDCVGKTGPPGTPGTDGTDGTNGQDGPPPTQEQIDAAVSSYCGQETDPCRGPKGDPGDPAPADGGATDLRFINCTGPIKDLDQASVQYDASNRVIIVTCP